MKHLIHNPAKARSGSCLGMCCSIVEPVPPTVSESFTFVPLFDYGKSKHGCTRVTSGFWLSSGSHTKQSCRCEYHINRRIECLCDFSSRRSQTISQHNFHCCWSNKVIEEFLLFSQNHYVQSTPQLLFEYRSSIFSRSAPQGCCVNSSATRLSVKGSGNQRRGKQKRNAVSVENVPFWLVSEKVQDCPRQS